MVIDVRQVSEGLSRIDGLSALEAFADELPSLANPVRCGVDLDRTGDVIMARLRYDADLTMQCARCLENYTLTVGGDTMFFIKHESERVGDNEDSPDFFFDERHESVDVSSVIYDDIMIALPLKPLCAEDCAGIAHSVEVSADTDIDPRWAALRKIKS